MGPLSDDPFDAIPRPARTRSVEIRDEELRSQIELKGILSELEEEEENLRKALEEALSILSESSQTRTPQDDLLGSERQVAILEHEYSVMSASLEALENPTKNLPQTLLTPSTQSKLAIINFDKRLHNIIPELILALEWETEQNETERQKLERDKVLEGDAVFLNEELLKRMEDEQSTKPDREGEELIKYVRLGELISVTRVKAEALDLTTLKLTKALQDFIDTRLNVDGVENDCDSGRRKRRKVVSQVVETPSILKYFLKYFQRAHNNSNSDRSNQEIDSPSSILQQLLEVLINQSIQNPDFPYIKLPNFSSTSGISQPTPENPLKDNVVPPEILDFLKRAGIIVVNPDEVGQIKLVEFGRSFQRF